MLSDKGSLSALLLMLKHIKKNVSISMEIKSLSLKEEKINNINKKTEEIEKIFHLKDGKT